MSVGQERRGWAAPVRKAMLSSAGTGPAQRAWEEGRGLTPSPISTWKMLSPMASQGCGFAEPGLGQ